MWIDKLHKAFVSNWLLLIAVIFVYIFYKIGGSWDEPEVVASVALQVGTALFLMQLNHIFSFIRTRTLLPALIYLLLTFNVDVSDKCLIESLITFIVALNLLFLFRSYQAPQSQGNSFNIAVILTIGSLFWQPLLFLFLVFWTGFYRFQSLTRKVFLASIVGFLTVYLFLFAWFVYADDLKAFVLFLPSKELLMPQLIMPDIFTLLIMGLTGAVLVWEGYNLFITGLSETVKTVQILNYLYIVLIIIFVCAFLKSTLQPQWEMLLSIPASMLLAHFFSLTDNKLVKYAMPAYFILIVTLGFMKS